MNVRSFITRYSLLTLGAVLLFVCAGVIYSQEKAEKVEKAHKADKAEYKAKHKEFCSSNNWSNGDKVSFTELREMTLPASGSLNIDGGKNGGCGIRARTLSATLA